MKILVLGGTGYIGSHLMPHLLGKGHQVRCLVRNPDKIKNQNYSNLEIVTGDVLNPETLNPAFKDIEVVYYLVHSLSSGISEFEEKDRLAAKNIAQASSKFNIQRIIYLGGLGKDNQETSPHLRSRHEVGNILRSSQASVTEFRAAVIIGTGSASFQIIHNLVKRLPVMICPKWVYVKTQPIAMVDVLRYLLEALEKRESIGKIIDIGGTDILSYGQMMLIYAKERGWKRLLIPVPFLTPKISSYWLKLMTPVQYSLAKSLILGVKNETICENNLALEIFGFIPHNFHESIQMALNEDKNDL